MLIRKGRGKEGWREGERIQRYTESKVKPIKGLPGHSRYVLSKNPARQGRRLYHAVRFRAWCREEIGRTDDSHWNTIFCGMRACPHLGPASEAPGFLRAQHLLQGLSGPSYALSPHTPPYQSRLLLLITTMFTFLNYCLVTVKAFTKCSEFF